MYQQNKNRITPVKNISLKERETLKYDKIILHTKRSPREKVKPGL
ncbi:hypothetical protein lacNasYZ03_11540 [Lactobacillus nasalidis]|uniref:Uncharacterized protein n=1 Tax=Lactobacillus nasalidis TaxID=2797258 RepID=A0ABQ3W786_9LACO|nr:hypothetical protein lacNasYZ01_10600 [Lactobacillus nasalidis]GHW00108.1 hypothetical protein lacNasYZ02_15370 [Lactobacillus nasalidis]GHW01467.1 hypothetical protein lacNasYZ03_11540 [Lactobacillus nasalidis]